MRPRCATPLIISVRPVLLAYIYIVYDNRNYMYIIYIYIYIYIYTYINNQCEYIRTAYVYAIIYDIYLYCILIVIRASARFSNLGRVFLVLVLVVVVGKSELRIAHCILIYPD